MGVVGKLSERLRAAAPAGFKQGSRSISTRRKHVVAQIVHAVLADEAVQSRRIFLLQPLAQRRHFAHLAPRIS